MALDLNAFKGKRVFITGHNGFKGAWLTKVLTMAGASVTGYSLKPTVTPNHFELLGLGNAVNSIEGDIRDLKKLQDSIAAAAPEVVFHLAAQALVRKSYADPIETISTNVLGSANLLEAVRNTASVKALVYITSDKAYENVEWEWGYRENDLLGGRDPYSASKGAAELIFSTYLRSYFEERAGFGAASARAGNVIGGGDWSADRIIPDAIRAIESGNPVQLRNPNATRPWQHVLEPISGYLLLAENLLKDPKKYSSSWNFGPRPNQSRKVVEIVSDFVNFYGKGSFEISTETSSQHEAGLLQLNCDKANNLLSWEAKWDVSYAVKQTADWYKRYAAGEASSAITSEQIVDYFPQLARS